MINPDFEIDRFRHNLLFNGYDQRDAAVIVNNAHDDVNNAISELVVDAISEATNTAENLGIRDFSQQVKAVKSGGTYIITTESGRTDFSTEEKQMLYSLLKNAKRAKDGSLYKRIPIKKSGLKNIFDAQIDMAEKRKAMMDSVKKEIAAGESTIRSAGTFSGLSAAKQFIDRKQQLQRQSNDGEVEFRTASSKQNPSTIWVQPPKEKDMTMILMEINRKLEDNIQQTVVSIIKSYEEQFL